MSNEHRNTQHAGRTGSVNPNPAGVISSCAAPDSWDESAAEIDMFSRWIKISDEVLAPTAYAGNKRVSRCRRSWESACRRSWIDFKFPISSPGQSKSGAGSASV